MAYKHDQSYGVVPLHMTDGEVQVLLVNQIGARGDLFWTLPKGHPEAGETPEMTALRELAEETGLDSVELDTAQMFTSQYTFRHEGVQIFKRVDYFIGWCTDTKTVISQPHEIAEIGWYTLAEAVDCVPHTNTKDILRSVVTTL